MNLTLEQAKEMAEALTTDNLESISTLGAYGDEVAILLHARVAELEADLRAAAGDLPVSIPEPGTDMARLLSANVLLRRRVAELQDQIQREGRMIAAQEGLRQSLRTNHDRFRAALEEIRQVTPDCYGCGRDLCPRCIADRALDPEG